MSDWNCTVLLSCTPITCRCGCVAVFQLAQLPMRPKSLKKIPSLPTKLLRGDLVDHLLPVKHSQLLHSHRHHPGNSNNYRQVSLSRILGSSTFVSMRGTCMIFSIWSVNMVLYPTRLSKFVWLYQKS